MKSVFSSKTMWFNVLMGTIMTVQTGIIPQKFAVPILAVGNVILRLLTNGPVALLPETTDKS